MSFTKEHFIKIKKTDSQLSKFILHKINQNKNVDVVILDAYPNFKIIRDSFKSESKLSKYLIEKEFKEIRHLSYSSSTPISIAQLFFNYELFSTKEIFNLKDRITYSEQIIEPSKLKSQCIQKNMNLNFYSITNYLFDSEAWKIYWNSSKSKYYGLFVRTIGNLSKLNFIIQNLSTNFNQSIDDKYMYQKIDQYNQHVLTNFENNLKSQQAHLNIYHILTFHKYNRSNPLKAFKNDLQFADSLSLSMINKLISKNNSTIIILSDHGNRTMLKSAYSKKMGIMAIKEL